MEKVAVGSRVNCNLKKSIEFFKRIYGDMDVSKKSDSRCPKTHVHNITLFKSEKVFGYETVFISIRTNQHILYIQRKATLEFSDVNFDVNNLISC